MATQKASARAGNVNIDRLRERNLLLLHKIIHILLLVTSLPYGLWEWYFLVYNNIFLSEFYLFLIATLWCQHSLLGEGNRKPDTKTVIFSSSVALLFVLLISVVVHVNSTSWFFLIYSAIFTVLCYDYVSFH